MALNPRRILAITVLSAVAAPILTAIGETGVHFLDRAEGPLAEVAWIPLLQLATIRGVIAGLGIGLTERSWEPGVPRHFGRDWMATASSLLFLGFDGVRRFDRPVLRAVAPSLFAAVVMSLFLVAIYRGVLWVIEPRKS